MDCPCCGRPVENRMSVDLGSNRFYSGGAMVQLSPSEAELGHMLVESYPRTVSYESLLWGLYGPSDENGKNPDKTLQVFIAKLRKKVGKIGVSIEVGNRRGYRLVLG
jgi:DNA-binding response OmpR family regulator